MKSLKIKKLFLFLIVLTMGISSSSFAFEPGPTPLNELDGFRGKKWGARIENFQGMVRLGPPSNDLPNIVQYKKKHDKLQLGKLKLTMIFYFFWRSEFSIVCLQTKGYYKWIRLQHIAFEKFGEGNQVNEEKYTWGNPYIDKSTVELQYFKDSELANLCIAGSEQILKFREAHKKHVEKALKDF